MPVEVTTAGYGTLTPEVQGGQSIQLPGIGYTYYHAELLVDLGVGGGRFHSAEFQGRAPVLVQVREDIRRPDCPGGEADPLLGPDNAGRFTDGGTVFGNEHAGNAVVSLGAVDIFLHHGGASGVACPDGSVQLLYSRLHKLEGRISPIALIGHAHSTRQGQGRMRRCLNPCMTLRAAKCIAPEANGQWSGRPGLDEPCPPALSLLLPG